MDDTSRLIAELHAAIDLANRRMFAELAAWQCAQMCPQPQEEEL